MTRAVQKFSKEYVAQSTKLTPEQALNFLEEYRLLYFGALASSKMKSKSRLISIKIPELLLEAFRAKAQTIGSPYQTQIKKLMEEWILKS